MREAVCSPSQRFQGFPARGQAPAGSIRHRLPPPAHASTSPSAGFASQAQAPSQRCTTCRFYSKASIGRHHPRSRTVCLSTEVAASPSEARQLLTAEQELQWQTAAEHVVSNTGLSEEAAGTVIAKGHAWTSHAYWGSENVNMVPDPDHVLDVLQYLQFTLGLEGPDLQKVVKAFPEVLACSLEDRLEPNVQRFQKEWFMKGDVLKKAIVRKPTLLGLSVDCSTVGAGACMGQCSKCWSAN